MTDATLEQNAEETQESNAPSEEETQKVTQYIANDNSCGRIICGSYGYIGSNCAKSIFKSRKRNG